MNNPEICPNAAGCQILNVEGFVENEQRREFYKTLYCINSAPDGFPCCKRFQTKKILGFCPNFVFPDSKMTIDEIMEQCEID